MICDVFYRGGATDFKVRGTKDSRAPHFSISDTTDEGTCSITGFSNTGFMITVFFGIVRVTVYIRVIIQQF